MNILLFVAEDSGPHLGCYGDLCAQTPNLDRLAAEGTCFTNNYATQAVCSPGRASILTGLYPHQNGQIGLATHRFSMYREFPTIPSILKAAGYRTGRIGKLHVLPESASPFDMVWQSSEHWSFQHRDTEMGARAASDFISDGEAPFFLMMNFRDAHLPWLSQECGYPETPLQASDVEVPPGVGCDSERLRAQTADYYNCLSRLDSGVGLVLEALEKSGKAEETLVIFTADHGPQFSRGKAASNELSLRIPLVTRWPGVNAVGDVRKELTSQIDLLPTVCDAAGLAAPAGLHGRSLRPLISGDTPHWRDNIFGEWTTSHPYPSPALLYPQRCVRNERYKLIHNLLAGVSNPVENYYTQQEMVKTGCSQGEIDAAPEAVQKAYALWRNPPEFELYDLQEDPWEYVNLADDVEHQPTVNHLKAILQTWQKETHDPLANPEELTRFVEEHHAASLLEGGHKSPDFHWKYLERYLNQ